MVVLKPPAVGYNSSVANQLVEIVTAEISNMRYTEDYISGDAKVQFTLSGESARRVLHAYGVGPARDPLPFTQPVNHQDEALAAARRDAAEAKRRAEAAENQVTALIEELRDYEGEIEALSGDLEAEKKRSKWARGGIIAVDPGNPSAPPLYATTPPPGTSIHSISSAPMYSAHDAVITKNLFDKLNSKFMSEQARSRIEREQFTLEGE